MDNNYAAVPEWAETGLQGIEVSHPDHSPLDKAKSASPGARVRVDQDWRLVFSRFLRGQAISAWFAKSGVGMCRGI
ncbi:hypothetical protein EJP82_12640 [Paenibacillus anaericanus]|uniref:Uncharacterized protein n=1 Tax=Paenibacillus anaericanus TaxID=170367 RepID=A0A3S1BPE0_9BACL|nr:hypothetical protein [Paenibacillus anaericanus]RUT46317.1 hypothetical protein EJP82_12640 [Paenibacillus anaericanus]